MEKKEKKRLMKKYNIKSVGGGIYADGFFTCLQGIDKGYIKIPKKRDVPRCSGDVPDKK